jgi:hypothetical protein
VSEIKETSQICDNVWVKMHHFERAGMVFEGHAHVFDHITLLATGSVLMKHDNGQQQFKAPHLIVTPKGIKHEFVSLEPNTLFCCVHAIRDGDSLEDVAPQDISQEDAFKLIHAYPFIS